MGELVSGLSRYPDELVSTGEKMAESAYWQRVVSRYAEKSGCVPAESFAWLARCTHPRQFLTWLCAGTQHPAVLNAGTVRSVRGTVGKGGAVANCIEVRSLLCLKLWYVCCIANTIGTAAVVGNIVVGRRTNGKWTRDS